MPSSRAVAVWLALDMLAAERVPWWAAKWLADGHDGRALRELAGLNGKDSRAVRDLLPAALDETGAELPPTQLAAATVAFRDVAQLLIAHRTDPKHVIGRVAQIIVQGQWEGGWGRTHAELKAEVETRCLEQLEVAAPRPSRRSS